MERKFQYAKYEDREKIINENVELFLIEEQNLLEGNFLIFSDVPRPIEPIYVDVSKEELEALKNDNATLKETVDLILTEIIPSIVGGI